MKLLFRKSVSALLSVALVFGLGFLGSFYLTDEASAQPNNPIDQMIENSRLPVAEASTITVEQDILDMKNDITDASSDALGENSLGDVYDGAGNASGEPIGIPSEEGEGEGQGEGEGAEELPKGPYFRTNLSNYNGETIDKNTDPREFKVTIEHLVPGWTAQSIEFYQNGSVCSTYSGNADGGTFEFVDGTNIISFKIVYGLEDGSVQEARSIDFTIYYQDIEKDIGIWWTHDDKGNEFIWNDSRLSFEAGTNPAEGVNLEVSCGSDHLFSSESGFDGGTYTANLVEGENIIRFSATGEGKNPAYREVKVIYEKANGLHINTDLRSTTVYQSEFQFFVQAIGVQSDDSSLTVKQNGTSISAHTIEGNTYHFTTTLGLGEQSTFYVLLTDADQKPVELTATIRYTRDPNAEKPSNQTVDLYTNISDDMVVNQDILEASFSATDQDGNTIYTNGFTVTVNGQAYGVSEAVGTRFVYRLPLNEGSNALTVTVRNGNEYTFDFNYVIIYEKIEEDKAIGTVQVSVEASTIGKGTLASGSVEIFSGQPASYAVVRFLENNGFECVVKGTLDNSLYLQFINKAGITAHVKVPTDLLDALEASYPGAYHGGYVADSLGEGDFSSSQSGWLVTVNGSSISGLSNAYLNDGDSVHIWFSLANGKDVGWDSSSGFSKVW